MALREIEQLLDYKKGCLLEEYKVLTSQLQRDSDIGMRIKNWCITVWLLGMGLSLESKISPALGMSAIIVMLLAF
jgi:hypothetical protein